MWDKNTLGSKYVGGYEAIDSCINYIAALKYKIKALRLLDQTVRSRHVKDAIRNVTRE